MISPDCEVVKNFLKTRNLAFVLKPKPAKPEANKKSFLPQDYLMITWIYFENLV